MRDRRRLRSRCRSNSRGWESVFRLLLVLQCAYGSPLRLQLRSGSGWCYTRRRGCGWSSDGVAAPTRCVKVSGDDKFNCPVQLTRGSNAGSQTHLLYFGCPRLDGLWRGESKPLPLHGISSRELARLVFETVVSAANMVNERAAGSPAQKAPKW
jgi:hypothetical protein